MAINVIVNGQDSITQNNFYGTVGTTAITVLTTSVYETQGSNIQGPSQLRQLLQIHNPTALNGASIAYTTDGTTPVIGGAGITLFPGGTSTYDVRVPAGPINLIASASSTAYSIIAI